MPPKKKQEEIDLSTLPQCSILNAFLMSKGKKSRAEAILNKINKKFQAFTFHVQKASVLDHAKEKGIYVDPESLTDKQKKDPKFMQTVCTEMTPEVLAKATQSFISNHNIKFRLQMKANLDKPEEERVKNTKKFDCLYIFDDYPTETVDFEALANAKQNIAYAFVVEPKIVWASAPEMPQQGQQQIDEEPEPEDEEIIEYKKYLEAEKLTEADIEYEKEINEKIKALKQARRNANKNSLFRNTVISQIQGVVDPYDEQNSIQTIANQLITQIDQLITDYQEYQEWSKDKNAEKLMEEKQATQSKQEDQKVSDPQQGEDQQKPASKQASRVSTASVVRKTNQTLSLLMEIVENISIKNQSQKKEEEEDFKDLEDFNFQMSADAESNNVPIEREKTENPLFFEFNNIADESKRNVVEEIIQKLKFPGIDRFMIPEVPTKSEGVRKKYRASFGTFLPQNLTFNEFERKLDLLNLEETAKQNDEERTYDFSDRIYEEQHDKKSLMRELNKALLFDESTICMKYNENNDKLYLALLYKNPVRRMNKKYWESNWKVLPNYESWLKHFKENETNMNNTSYFDIDYEAIGNIQEQAHVYTIKNGGAVIRKNSRVAGKQNDLLYCLAGEGTADLIFGVRKNNQKKGEFYGENQLVKILQTNMTVKSQEKQQKQQNQSYDSTFLTFKDRTTLQLKNNTGDLIIRKPGFPDRLVTRKGYTVIYEGLKNQNSSTSTTILHPNGSISHPPNQYINESGRGLKDLALQNIPTLKRTTSDGKQVIKRDDGTIIVKQSKNSKLIKFPDSTEYLCEQDGMITIEKSFYPIIKCCPSKMVVSYNGVIVTSDVQAGKNNFHISFQRVSTSNASTILIHESHIEVNDGKSGTPYICDICTEEPSILKKWENQSLQIWYSKSQYTRDGKVLNPLEDEEFYTEQDFLQPDYLQPKLFIISNNNTGKEILCKQQIASGYLKTFSEQQSGGKGPKNMFQSNCQEIISKTEDGSSRNVRNGIIGLKSLNQLNKKVIQKVEIDLDVYKNVHEDECLNYPVENYMQVRSLIENSPLTQEDRELIEKIKKSWEETKAKRQKEENQFGNKPRKDPSTEENYQARLSDIKYRKQPEQAIFYAEMKENVIETYQSQRQQKKSVLQNMRKQEQMRNKMNRKKTYVSQYMWIEPAARPYDENMEYYTADQSFYTNYFKTAEGKKALKGMPDWVFKPKQKKSQQELDPQIKSELLNRTRKQQQFLNRTGGMNRTNGMNNTNQNYSANQDEERHERYDTVEVDINPTSQVYIKPSVFTQREIDEERFAFQSEKKAYEYHEMKRKDFDVYGRERKEGLSVPSLLRTQPVSELNQKYLVTEAPVDKKIKISSMKNKLTSEASNMTEMRREGPHANLIRTLDKRNDYSKLLERRTMMVQADLNDKLQRDIQINPVQANFGMVKEGTSYELKIQIKNEDILSQRIQLKKPKSIFCKVIMNEMGPLALGMTRKITVQFKASAELSGRFSDQFDIVTKHEIYHIPITAHVQNSSQFDANRSVISKGVRQFQQISLKKKKDQLPPIQYNNN